MTRIPRLVYRSIVIVTLASVSLATCRAADGPQRTVTLDLGKDIIPAVEGHSDELCAVAYSPDGKTLATAGRDLAIRVWKADTRECKLVLKGHAKGELVDRTEWDWTPLSQIGRAHV